MSVVGTSDFFFASAAKRNCLNLLVNVQVAWGSPDYSNPWKFYPITVLIVTFTVGVALAGLLNFQI